MGVRFGIGRYRLELVMERYGIWVRLPLIGQGHKPPRQPWAWDRWADAKDDRPMSFR